MCIVKVGISTNFELKSFGFFIETGFGLLELVEDFGLDFLDFIVL